MSFLSMTTLQDNAVDNLHSRIDDLWLEDDPDFIGNIFFTGDSEDGPCAGYIDRDGSIEWITGGFQTNLW